MDTQSSNVLPTLSIESNAAPTLPMQFGVPLDQSSLVFFICLIAAIGLVYLYCRQKFNERSAGASDDFVYQLLPRQLATNQEYAKGFMTYFGTMAFSVLLLSLIGPKNLGALGINIPEQIGYAAPLAVAFIVVGVLPTVPGLLEIERILRKYAHERAYIPASTLATAERLSAADFDFSAYAREALQSPDLRGVAAADFGQPRRSLEHDWARLSCLVYELKARRLSGDFGGLDADLLRSYQRDLQSIEEGRDTMLAEVKAYRAERKRNPAYANKELRNAIRSSLYKLYVLLTCAVRLKKQPHADIDLTLRTFGFHLSRTPPASSNGDLKLVGVCVVAGSVLLLEFAAVAVGKLGLWRLSPVFPEQLYQPFIDTASILIPHVVAIMVADPVRRRAMKCGVWAITPRRNWLATAANHLRVALPCGVAGYLGMVLWGFAFQSLTREGLLIDLPQALLAMVTGGFYVYHLDNVETGRRPFRLAEIGWQTMITAVCGLIAASVSFELILGEAAIAIDKIALTAAVSLAIGCVLAWYIPEAASAARRDPLAEAREERIRTLGAVAGERFGDAGRAADWLDSRCPELGDKSPRRAATDVEGFEHAISVLRCPSALAA